LHDASDLAWLIGSGIYICSNGSGILSFFNRPLAYYTAKIAIANLSSYFDLDLISSGINYRFYFKLSNIFYAWIAIPAAILASFGWSLAILFF